MRILLIGEYSRLHNSLKEGLAELGHEVTLIGNGDGFKNFPVDTNIDAKISKSGLLNKLRQAIFKISKYDIAAIEYGIRFYFLLPKLKDFDVVQLVSETPIQTVLWLEYYLLSKIHKQNKKLFLLSSGTDVPFVNAAAEKKFRYSLLEPYQKDPSVIGEYRHVLWNLRPKYKTHHQKMYSLINGVIATDIDYMIGLEANPKFLGMIPNPVNVKNLSYRQYSINEEKIVLFHGINRLNYFKKGNRFFEEALAIIEKKYPDKIHIITAESLPYDEYIKAYDMAHILLDQVYAYDQGYNALEAMAKGKVVFTGAEKEFESYYNLTEKVAINALPDARAIADEMELLINNPQEISNIGKRARQFIEAEHDYIKSAERYLRLWNDN